MFKMHTSVSPVHFLLGFDCSYKNNISNAMYIFEHYSHEHSAICLQKTWQRELITHNITLQSTTISQHNTRSISYTIFTIKVQVDRRTGDQLLSEEFRACHIVVRKN